MTETVKAYLAGIIDGEGWITVVRGGNSARKVWGQYNGMQVSLGCSTTHKETLALLHKNFGGSLRLQPSKNPKHKSCWSWTLRSRSAAKAMETLLPYLKIKLPQAELALRFQRTVKPTAGSKITTRDGNGRILTSGKKLSDDELDVRKEIWHTMKALNRRGPETLSASEATY